MAGRDLHLYEVNSENRLRLRFSPSELSMRKMSIQGAVLGAKFRGHLVFAFSNKNPIYI